MAGIPYRTVSDEMARTDWSDRHAELPAASGPRWAGLAAALAVVAAMLAAAIFLLPPNVA